MEGYEYQADIIHYDPKTKMITRTETWVKKDKSGKIIDVKEKQITKRKASAAEQRENDAAWYGAAKHETSVPKKLIIKKETSTWIWLAGAGALVWYFFLRK